jgi:hypothetical protein
MKKSELKSYIKEEVKNILTTEASKEEISNQKELNQELEKTTDLVSKMAQIKNVKEQEEDEGDDWYKSKDEDGDKNKEPSKSDLKKDAKATKSMAKAKDELARLTKEMKSLAKKYKEAEGAAKEKIVTDLKAKTKLKKELEAILNVSVNEMQENGFKVGDKVTYLGHPASITSVKKDTMGRTVYSVSYNKGMGATKATNIYNKDGEIEFKK